MEEEYKKELWDLRKRFILYEGTIVEIKRLLQRLELEQDLLAKENK